MDCESRIGALSYEGAFWPRKPCSSHPASQGKTCHDQDIGLSKSTGMQTVTLATAELSAGLIFEQEPSQILDALLPLYLSCTLLRSLQVTSGCVPQALEHAVHCGCCAPPA